MRALIVAALIAAAPAQAQFKTFENPNEAVDRTISILRGATDVIGSMRNMTKKIGELAERARTSATPGNQARQANSLSEQLEIIASDATFGGVNLIGAGQPDHVADLPDGTYTVPAVDLSRPRLRLVDFDFSSKSGIDRARERAANAIALMTRTERSYRERIAELNGKRVAYKVPGKPEKGAPADGAAPAGSSSGGLDVDSLIQRLKTHQNKKP